MAPDLVFSIANSTALAGWLALVAGILLRRPFWRDRIAGLAIPLTLSVAYMLLIAIFWWSAEGGFDSLPQVQKLFTSPWVALAGWIHYLAFDLAIGAWLARRILERGITRWILLPILPLSFLFGPIGFVLGQAVLLAQRRSAP